MITNYTWSTLLVLERHAHVITKSWTKTMHLVNLHAVIIEMFTKALFIAYI